MGSRRPETRHAHFSRPVILPGSRVYIAIWRLGVHEAIEGRLVYSSTLYQPRYSRHQLGHCYSLEICPRFPPSHVSHYCRLPCKMSFPIFLFALQRYPLKVPIEALNLTPCQSTPHRTTSQSRSKNNHQTSPLANPTTHHIPPPQRHTIDIDILNHSKHRADTTYLCPLVPLRITS